MFCEKCGKEIADEAVMCVSCGNSLQLIQSNTTPKDKLPKLPNAIATLVLGICSIVFCCGIGTICGIVALAISGESNKLLNENPDGYSDAGNHKAGRICAIIGLILSGLFLIYYIAIVGLYASNPYYY